MTRLITKKEREEVIDYCFQNNWPEIACLKNSDYIKIKNTLGFQIWKTEKEFNNLLKKIKKEFNLLFKTIKNEFNILFKTIKKEFNNLLKKIKKEIYAIFRK